MALDLVRFVDVGIGVASVWKLATRMPARLGEPGLGTIEEGAPADILLFRTTARLATNR